MARIHIDCMNMCVFVLLTCILYHREAFYVFKSRIYGASRTLVRLHCINYFVWLGSSRCWINSNVDTDARIKRASLTLSALIYARVTVHAEHFPSTRVLCELMQPHWKIQWLPNFPNICKYVCGPTFSFHAARASVDWTLHRALRFLLHPTITLCMENFRYRPYLRW